ncbi:MAG TPA: arginine deiminase-related protein [Hyalangium sp.]|nr:arginine deiminase-related protein [Hyalangium sp.]
MSRVDTTPTRSLVVSGLFCDKDHARGSDCAYRVDWSINPHMRAGTAVNLRRACAQHRALVHQLRQAGAEVLHVPFVHGAYDSVFAKDNALLLERHGRRQALMASPRFGERGREQEARARMLEGLGFEHLSPPHAHFEGGDVIMLPGSAGALLGYGQRSSEDALPALEDFLGAPVKPLRLQDPYFFHLDLAVAVLEDGTALVCQEALACRGHGLEGVEGITRIIPVPYAEAAAFALNLVQVGEVIILGAEAPWTQALLMRLGYRALAVNLDQFHLAGGSAACLVAQLHSRATLGAHAHAAVARLVS